MPNRLNIMKQNQLNCSELYKLSEKDLKRILKYTNIDIFGDQCVIWNGYITQGKNKYINFFYKGKKIALHRLLYINFVGELDEHSYLTYICENAGICCNVNHIKIKNSQQATITKHNITIDDNEVILVKFD